MNDALVTTEMPATELARWLAGSQSEPGLIAYPIPYRGVLTPRYLDAPEAETRAWLHNAVVHDLGWLRRIDIRGEDRFRWLSGMVTNNVESLAAGHGAYNLVLNAQGRIQGDAYVWRNGDELTLEMTADQADGLIAHLDRFIIMDDVEMKLATRQSALGLTGPLADKTLESLGLAAIADQLTSADAEIAGIAVRLKRTFGAPIPHYQVWALSESMPAVWKALCDAGATPVGADTVERFRVAEGVPVYGVDIQSRDLPQETSQDRALSFTKGCYLGQEIVERIRSRGQVHRHLRQMELSLDIGAVLPVPGSELRFAGEPDAKPLGNLTSIAEVQVDGITRVFALGVVRAEAEVSRRALIFSGGTAVLLDRAPKLS